MKTRPIRSFKSQTALSWGVAYPCSTLWNVGTSRLDDAVLRTSPLRKVNYATLFAYMCRRFGFPHRPGDDYKDLSGSWMLSTPSKSVVVEVSPSLSNPCFSFTPMWVRDKQEDRSGIHHVGDLKLSAGQVAEVGVGVDPCRASAR